MKYILIFYFGTLFNIIQAQENSLGSSIISKTVLNATSYVGTDEYGSVYFLQNNVLLKETQGKTLSYENIAFGKIKQVLIGNPLEILIFYENFNSVVILDNQLNEMQKINFSATESNIILGGIGISAQNKIWIYNTIDRQLGLYNLVTHNYQKVGVPFVNNKMIYLGSFNFFYWIDTKNNLFSCDNYGTKKYLGIIPDYDVAYISDEKTICFLKNEIYYILDIPTGKYWFIDKIFENSKNFYFKNQILSIFTSKEIINYKISKP